MEFHLEIMQTDYDDGYNKYQQTITLELLFVLFTNQQFQYATITSRKVYIWDGRTNENIEYSSIRGNVTFSIETTPDLMLLQWMNIQLIFWLWRRFFRMKFICNFHGYMDLEILHLNSVMKHSLNSSTVYLFGWEFEHYGSCSWITFFFVIVTIIIVTQFQIFGYNQQNSLYLFSWNNSILPWNVAHKSFNFFSIELRFRMWFCNLFDHLMLCNVVWHFAKSLHQIRILFIKCPSIEYTFWIKKKKTPTLHFCSWFTWNLSHKFYFNKFSIDNDGVIISQLKLGNWKKMSINNFWLIDLKCFS